MTNATLMQMYWEVLRSKPLIGRRVGYGIKIIIIDSKWVITSQLDTSLNFSNSTNFGSCSSRVRCHGATVEAGNLHTENNMIIYLVLDLNTRRIDYSHRQLITERCLGLKGVYVRVQEHRA